MNERKGRRSAATVGRPRDPDVDDSILAATRDLLAETGYSKTTVAAIGRRAGIGTAAIYRRWATKESIVEDAVFGPREVSLPEPTGNLEADLLSWTALFLARIAEPATRVAIPGLLSAYDNHDAVYELLVMRSESPAREALTRVVAAARPELETETLSEATESAFDLLMSATLVRGITHGRDEGDAFSARMARALTAVIDTAHQPTNG